MPETAAPDRTPVGYLAVVKHNPNYRSMWFGEIVSLFGDWFNLIASAALISNLTQSGLAVGGLFVVRMLAPFLVSPIAGVAADRFNRKRLLILSDLARFVVVLGFLLVRNAEQVWLLYTLTAIQLGISGFFFPARNSLLPDIVSRGELGAANALSSTTWSVMLALGAAVGGLVAGEWGIYPAFLIDAGSFLVSALFLSRIQYTPKPAAESTEQTLSAAYRQYIEGLRYLKEHADVFVIALHKAAISFTVSSIFQVIMVVLAEEVFPIGKGGGTSLGLMFAINGVGTGLGPILTRRFTGDHDRLLQRALLFSYVITVAGVAVTAPLASFALVLFGTFLRSFGSGINWVFSTQLLLQNVSDQVRGRVFSTEFALFTLASAGGTAIGGWLLDGSGLSISDILWVTAGASAVPGILWLLWLAARERTLDRKREEQAAAPLGSHTTGDD